MPTDSRRKWVEFHLRAAHAQLGATQDAKQDDQAGHEQSGKVLEHSAKIFSADAGEKRRSPRGEKSCNA